MGVEVRSSALELARSLEVADGCRCLTRQKDGQMKTFMSLKR